MSQPYNQGFGMQESKGPRSLDALSRLSKVELKQKIHMCEVMSGCEIANKFWINTPEGETIYYCRENSSLGDRLCCGNIRPMTITIEDDQGKPIVEIERPLKCMGCCCSCCYPTCTQEMSVRVEGQDVGKVEEIPTWWNQVINVYDNSGNKIYKIRGGSCFTFCCNDIPFQILDLDGNEVGSITKMWKGFCKEAFTDADTFKLDFGDNMELYHKVLILGATFLLDFMFFEKQDNNN